MSASASMNEERYRLLLDFITSSKDGVGLYPESFSKNERRGLRQQAQSFQEKDGSLFYSLAGGTKLCRVVVSKSEKERLLKACHGGIDGGHFGRDKTASKVCLT